MPRGLPAAARVKTLRVLRLEEAQERCVLGEQSLDLGDAGTCPILQPGLAEVVLDVVKAAFTHGRKYRHMWRTAPWAKRLIRGSVGPILPALERLPDRESALWPCASERGRARNTGAGARHR